MRYYLANGCLLMCMVLLLGRVCCWGGAFAVGKVRLPEHGAFAAGKVRLPRHGAFAAGAKST